MSAKRQESFESLVAIAEHAPAFLRVASVSGSVVMSLLILLGITRAQKTSVPPPVAPIEDLRALVMDPPPPPPPSDVEAPLPEPPSVLELPPVDEPGGISISAVIHPSPPPVPTVSPISLELNLNALKPGGETYRDSPRHVFQSREVDQRPVVLYREIPHITSEMMRTVKDPRVTLIFVVNTDGSVQDVRVLKQPTPEFGQVMVDAVKEWRFRPAIRDGRKVRCMIQLPIYVKPASSSPFQL